MRQDIKSSEFYVPLVADDDNSKSLYVPYLLRKSDNDSVINRRDAMRA